MHWRAGLGLLVQCSQTPDPASLVARTSGRAAGCLPPRPAPWAWRGRVPTHHVPLLVVLVLDDEDHVEARQDGGHEVDVVLPLRLIPAAEHRVGGGQDGAARVEGGGDAGLSGKSGGGRGQRAENAGSRPSRVCAPPRPTPRFQGPQAGPGTGQPEDRAGAQRPRHPWRGWAAREALTLAMEMVCCSMASWIATRSSSRICEGREAPTRLRRGVGEQRLQGNIQQPPLPKPEPCARPLAGSGAPRDPGQLCGLGSPPPALQVQKLGLRKVQLLPCRDGAGAGIRVCKSKVAPAVQAQKATRLAHRGATASPCRAHLVKLIDTDDTAIGQDHGPALHDEVPGRGVPHHRGGQASRAAALPRRVHLGRGTGGSGPHPAPASAASLSPGAPGAGAHPRSQTTLAAEQTDLRVPPLLGKPPQPEPGLEGLP